ncbi:hypothetical protein Dfri01_59600 [Dyadobacter frigoris]|nr:hypothetical protein Dfri01_59600 [Dyadobacter frigoris]
MSLNEAPLPPFNESNEAALGFSFILSLLLDSSPFIDVYANTYPIKKTKHSIMNMELLMTNTNIVYLLNIKLIFFKDIKYKIYNL